MPARFYGELNNYRNQPRTIRGYKDTGLVTSALTRSHEIKTVLFHKDGEDHVVIKITELKTGLTKYITPYGALPVQSLYNESTNKRDPK